MIRNRFCDFFNLIRYKNILILLGSQLFVFFLLLNEEVDFVLVALIGTTLSATAAGNLINDLFDIETDKVNKPNQQELFSFSKGSVFYWYGGFVALSLFLSFSLPFNALVMVWMNNVLLFLYSFKLKRLPIIGNVVVAYLSATSILLFLLVYQEAETEILIFSVFTFVIHLIRELIKDLEDVEGDRIANYKTLPVLVGVTVTKIVTLTIEALFFVLLMVFSIRLTTSLLIYNVLLSTPLLFLIIMKTIRANGKKQYCNISGWCKLLMLFGVFGMLFV